MNEEEKNLITYSGKYGTISITKFDCETQTLIQLHQETLPTIFLWFGPV
jgi:hypothetical protein